MTTSMGTVHTLTGDDFAFRALIDLCARIERHRRGEGGGNGGAAPAAHAQAVTQRRGKRQTGRRATATQKAGA